MEDSFRVFIGDRSNLQGLKFSHIFIKQGEKNIIRVYKYTSSSSP